MKALRDFLALAEFRIGLGNGQQGQASEFAGPGELHAGYDRIVYMKGQQCLLINSGRRERDRITAGRAHHPCAQRG